MPYKKRIGIFEKKYGLPPEARRAKPSGGNSIMGFTKNKCTKCGSSNITPYNKRQVRDKDICDYICEDCGCKMPNIVYYSKSVGGKV